MPVMIEQQKLLEFVKTLNGEILITSTRKTRFKANVVDGDLIFTPLSSGKSRREPANNLTKVLDHYNKSLSLTPKDYHDATFNSVYVITLLEMYRKYIYTSAG